MTRNLLAPFPFSLRKMSPFDDVDWMYSPLSWTSITPSSYLKDSTKCDVKETDTGFEIVADFPGVDKEDISIEVEDEHLTLSYSKKTETEENNEDGYVVKERSFKSFKRVFNLGSVDESSAKANLENGLLTITIDKKEPVSQKTSVEII